MYLGLGIHDNIKDLGFSDIGALDRALLMSAKFVGVRDPECARLLQPVSPALLPCPVLFASSQSRIRSRKINLALSTQGVLSGNGQKISSETFDFSKHLFLALGEEYNCTLVCHYVDEGAEVSREFGSKFDIAYASDSDDYLEIYDQFDLTVTTRVHGAGLCASMGIPGFLIDHSERSVTAENFLTELINPSKESIEGVLNRIREFDVAAASTRIIEHLNQTRDRYRGVLLHAFGAIPAFETI